MSTAAEQQRHRDALEALRQLRAQRQARVQSLSESESEAIETERSATEKRSGVLPKRDRYTVPELRRLELMTNPVVVSATEAKNRLGALLAELCDGADAVIIERHGRPWAVLVSVQDWTALVEARESLRRQEAWDQLWRLAAEGSVRNAVLTQDEANAIADELGDEAKRRVASRLTRW